MFAAMATQQITLMGLMKKLTKKQKNTNLKALCHMSEIQTMQLFAHSEMIGESH